MKIKEAMTTAADAIETGVHNVKKAISWRWPRKTINGTSIWKIGLFH